MLYLFMFSQDRTMCKVFVTSITEVDILTLGQVGVAGVVTLGGDQLLQEHCLLKHVAKLWLTLGFAASFAAKLADTFGSEIGKRWGSTPRLITTLRRVEPGTEGAISLEGTLASAAGSLVMSLVMWALVLVPSGRLMLLVAVVGFVATLAESVLGAIAQQRLSWMSNELVNALQTLLAAVLAMLLMTF